MNTSLRLYTVRLVRSAGQALPNGEDYPCAEQRVIVSSNHPQAAYQYARSVCQLICYGRALRIFIDEVEYSAY